MYVHQMIIRDSGSVTYNHTVEHVGSQLLLGNVCQGISRDGLLATYQWIVLLGKDCTESGCWIVREQIPLSASQNFIVWS